MIQFKRLFAAAALAGALGLTIFSSSSFANGPLAMGPMSAPVSVPKVMVVPSVRTVPIQTQMLKAYHQIRSFWLSRALVR
jgi:hypothetical protein